MCGRLIEVHRILGWGLHALALEASEDVSCGRGGIRAVAAEDGLVHAENVLELARDGLLDELLEVVDLLEHVGLGITEFIESRCRLLSIEMPHVEHGQQRALQRREVWWYMGERRGVLRQPQCQIRSGARCYEQLDVE